MRIASLAVPLVADRLRWPGNEPSQTSQADVSNDWRRRPPQRYRHAPVPLSRPQANGQVDHARAPRGNGERSASRTRPCSASSNAGQPDLGVVRAVRRPWSPTCDQDLRLVPGGHRPGHRQDRRQAGDLAEAGRFPRQAHGVPAGRRRFPCRRDRQRYERDQGELRQPRPGLQSLPRQISFARCTTEQRARAAGLGSARSGSSTGCSPD